MGLKEMMHTDTGSIVISVILGLGLACLFRKACTDNKCVIIKGPNIKEVESKVYKIRDSCYRYETEFAECDASKNSA
jgi:hypothetical protein